jgi:TrkA domain protein
VPVELRETRLPGIGVKYGFRTSEGGRLAIVLHNDGVREIYFFRHDQDDEPS